MWPTVWLSPGWHLFSDSPDWSTVQRPATWLALLQHQPGDLVAFVCFGSYLVGADTLMPLIKESAAVTYSQFIEDTVEPSYLPGIIFLFIMCIGIIRTNSLVDGRARAELNPSHWVRHALLHMAAECVGRYHRWLHLGKFYYPVKQ